MQSFQPVDDFLFGIIPYGTSIQENGIRLIQGFARLVSCHTHHRSHYFAVGHVHLATVSLYKKLFHAVLSNSGCKDNERRAQLQAKSLLLSEKLPSRILSSIYKVSEKK